MSETTVTKKLGVPAIVLMIFSVIFGFTNPGIAFFRMSYASIIWYIFGAITYFLPMMFIAAEYAVSCRNEPGGGIYTWMRVAKGEFYGFVGTFMWYYAVLVWFTGMSARTWVPLSCFLFGEDKTKSWSILGLKNTQTLGLIGILLILSITFLATKGFKNVSTVAKIGGLSCTIINVLLYITSLTILFFNKGFFEEPIKGISTFTKSPNPAHTPITLIGFVTFAVFAYGGIEGLGSLVEKAKSAKTFSKACIIGTLFISFGYSLAIFFWGISANYSQLNSNPDVNMGNILYVLMRNLGYKLGLCLNMSQEGAINLGMIFMRGLGLSMLLSFFGALFTLIYSPIKSLLDGAPKNMWPSFLYKKNKADMPSKAMWLQAVIICSLIAIISFSVKDMRGFFEILQLLSNIAQCIPYIFIIASFSAFRRNDSLNHEYTIIKSKSAAVAVSILSSLIVTAATVFTAFEPVIVGKDPDRVFKTSCMIIAPVAFFIISFIIFSLYKKRANN